MPGVLRTEKEVEAEFGIPMSTLRHWRRMRMGPRYRKLGRLVRYHRDDLDEWLRQSIRSSTAGVRSNDA
jgi:predicted DNA-binding transcriptional regulator AlpA